MAGFGNQRLWAAIARLATPARTDAASIGTPIAPARGTSPGRSWRLGLAGIAVFVAGCKFPLGEVDPCATHRPLPADAGTAELQPILGTQDGQLTWLETGTTTELGVTVELDGEVASGCPGESELYLRYEVTTADGLIDLNEQWPWYPAMSISFADVDAAKLLLGGVAPKQPDLLKENPVIELELEPNQTSFTSGTVRAKTTDQMLTLGIIVFGVDP